MSLTCGLVDAEEIIKGVQAALGVYLSMEEVHLLQRHLDKNGDGHVSQQEFLEKVTLKDY